MEIDQRYLGPTDVDLLQADGAKARQRLNCPGARFSDLVRIIVDADL